MSVNQFDEAVEQLGTDNPYDQVVRDRQTSTDAKLRTTVLQGSQQPPDRAAEARRIADRFGMPPSVVEGNFDAFQQRAKAEDASRIGQGAPALASWLSADRNNAAVSHDDLPQLSALERTIGIGRNLGGAAAAGVMDFSQGVWGAVQAAADTLGAATTAEVTKLSADDEQAFQAWAAANKITDVDQPGSHYDYRGYFQQFGAKPITFGVDHFTDTYKQHGHPTFSVESKYSRGSTDGGRWDGETFIPGPVHESIADFARASAIVAGHLADRARGRQRGAGFIEQSIYSGVESVGAMAPALAIGAVAGPGAMLASFGVTTGGQSYSTARGQGAGVGRSLLHGTIQGAVEVATEFIPAHRLLGDLAVKAPLIKVVMRQLVPEIAGEEVATVLQDMNEWALLPANKDRTWTDYLNQRPSAAAATAISTLVAVGSTTVLAHGTSRMLERLGEQVADSKTAQRMPAAVQDFLEQATKDGPISHVYAPIDAWTTYWQGLGEDPGARAAALTGDVTAYQTALATGEDLAIPLARYAVQLAGTEHNAFFKNELRLAPDQMNAREADVFVEQHRTAPAPPAVEPSPVYAAVLAQLTAAGVPATTAESYANLYDAAIGTMASRAGVDPRALFESYGLTITRPELDAARASPDRLLGTATTPAAEAGAGDPASFARLRAPLDTPLEPLHTEGPADASQPRARAESDTARIRSEGGVSASRPRDREVRSPSTGKLQLRRESATQRNERRVAHFDAVFADLDTAARALDPAVSPTDLRAEFDFRVAAWQEMQDLQVESGHNPLELLKAIAHAGGLGPDDPGVSGLEGSGYHGEIATLSAGAKLGRVHGYQVFRKTEGRAAGGARFGKTLGNMLEALADDKRFDWITDPNQLIDAIDDAIRHPVPEPNIFPGTDELRAMQIGREVKWWEDPWNPALEHLRPAVNDSMAAGEGTGDASFNINEFNQGEPPNPRAAIRFGPNRQMNIALLERADLSSFLHESGHLFLEIFGDLADQVAAIDTATRTDDQARLHDDYQAMLQWLGVESRGAIGTPQHEQFARAFEAYLMEGKAPSLELQSTFSRFRAWLLGIYRSITKLRVQLNPEVRGVLDRLVASDRAIADVQSQARIQPLFTTADEAGMMPAEFNLYKQTVADASQQAREQLDQRLMAEVQREREATWKAQRAEVQAAVEAEIYARPEYRAIAAMQSGTHPDGTPLVEGGAPPLKLSRQVIVDRYGAAGLKALPKGIYSREGGLDPDAAAELFGFSSGDALLQAVSEVPPMRPQIEQETTRRMLAEHGSILLDGTLHEEARAAIANEDRDRIIRAELRALRKLERTVAPFQRSARQEAKAGIAAIDAAIPPEAVLRDTAQRRIAGTPVRELTPARFWSASRRAAQKGLEATKAQHYGAAIILKQQELLNLYLYREATRALTDAHARVAFATELGKTSSRARLGLAGGTYLDQVDGILDRFEFAKVSNKALERRARIRDWMQALEAQGLPVADLPAEVMDDARRVNWKELTIEELVGVTDGLKQILHLARLKNKLLVSTSSRDFAEVRDGLAASIFEKNTARERPLEFRPSDQKRRSIADWFASHTKIATLARALDGHRDGGPMWESIIRSINAAADAEVTRKQADGKRYAAILEQYYPGRELATLNQKMAIPGVGSLSKEGRLAVALNWGNQTSRDRILADPNRRWSDVDVAAILDTLDERDWQFVQATWNFVNSYWDEIAAKQERVTGLPPEKVEAIPVTTKFGQLTGGYYPLVYDGRLSVRAEQHAAAGEAKLAAAAAYVSSTTRRGHTMTRQENVQLSVKLELGVLFKHLDQVIHDLTHHEMLIDTTRLLRDPAVSSAILETKGDQVYQQFTRALQDIALGTAPATNILEKSAVFMRTGTQLSLMGWNLWTAAQQPLGLFNGASRVGPRWVARGMKRWLRDAASMENTATWIAEVSPMMRERVVTGSQDLNDLRAELRQPGGWFDMLVRRVSLDHVTQQTIVDSYLWHIGLMQRVADVPTWLGQYEKSMAGGEPEARAIALADQAVLDSQGGGQIKDLAQVQRGGPVAKLFMTFYSYGNTVFNATSDVAGATNFKSPAQVATFLGHLSLLYVMPAMGTIALSRLFGRSGGDDWEDFLADVGRETLGAALNTMVLVRELGQLVNEGTRGYAGPAGARTIELVYNLGTQIKQGEPDAALARALNQVAGVLFRYPAAQVQRSVDGWVALEEGRTKNPAALLFGPTTGSARK